eukprot:7405206-Heterocapsa_arctica.AAC.1
MALRAALQPGQHNLVLMAVPMLHSLPPVPPLPSQPNQHTGSLAWPTLSMSPTCDESPSSR